ncbi:MAG: PRC-barrel domain-containing protein [Elusimicrobiota bacterium]
MKKQSWKVSDIAGSEVFDVSGEKIGLLADVLPSGGNDIWVVVNPSGRYKEILVPALKSVVKEVDVQNKKIVVQLPAGLKEIYQSEDKPADLTGSYED